MREEGKGKRGREEERKRGRRGYVVCLYLR